MIMSFLGPIRQKLAAFAKRPSYLYPLLVRKFLIYTWEIWEKMGIHITPDRFNSPIPNTKTLKGYNWEGTFPFDGITLDDDLMLRLLEKIHATKNEYYDRGSAYESNGDGNILYGLIREFKPKMIIEVGGGYSTAVSLDALRKNTQEIGQSSKILTIEPYPTPFLEELVAKEGNMITLIREKVEKVGIEPFMQLKAGDILFIDSSHVVKCGNDGHFLYLRLLPKIQVGTIIHIHDIRFPYDYPKEWLMEKKYFWNEQYLLHMFLCFNNSFKILFAANYMTKKYPALMRQSLKGFAEDSGGWPGCFWIQRIK